MFTHYFTQHWSIDMFLTFLGKGEHANIGTFNMLLPEMYFWNKSIDFVCACEQIFILALHPCVHFIQMLKNIRYASFAHHSSFVNNFASSLLSSVRNILSSSHSSYTWTSTFPWDSHQTSVWSNKVVCSAPISSHKGANMQLFWGLVFTKFTIYTTSSNTGAISPVKVYATSASRCKKQCITITSGFFSFTLLTKPLVHPTIAAASSVQILVQFSHWSPLYSRYSNVTWKLL